MDNLTFSEDNNTFTILGAITTDLPIANVTVTLVNVTNPYPATTTGVFVGKIGIDVSSNSSNAQSAIITLSPNTF